MILLDHQKMRALCKGIKCGWGRSSQFLLGSRSADSWALACLWARLSGRASAVDCRPRAKYPLTKSSYRSEILPTIRSSVDTATCNAPILKNRINNQQCKLLLRNLTPSMREEEILTAIDQENSLTPPRLFCVEGSIIPLTLPF